MSRYSPEPWIVSVETEGDNPDIFIEAKGETVAEICGGRLETRMTNAHLIKAAPRMLRALEIAHIRMFSQQAGRPNYPLADVLEMIRKAIAEANGA